MRYRFMRFPGGREKALTLSYDDGCRQDVRLIETANRYGIKVTLNVNSNLFGTEPGQWRLTARQVGELAASGGHEIAVHGAEHIAVGRSTAATGIREVLLCREALEKEFGGIIRGMAYADSGITQLTGGVSLEDIEHYLKDLDIAYGRTLGGDNNGFQMPENFYRWMPTAHHNNPQMMAYLEEFLDGPLPDYIAKRSPRLFYLWGHSYEFEQQDNWELLEEFCRKAGGHDEVWYATNIEICDYAAAYYALQFSMDNSRVFNPTCRDVWFEVDKEIFCAPAGKLTELTKK